MGYSPWGPKELDLTEGTEPGSSVLQVDSLPSEPPGKPKFPIYVLIYDVHFFFLTYCTL